MARRQAERNAKRKELLKCCNPAYAAAREMEKPQFIWTVDACWFDKDAKFGLVEFHRKQNVVAQHEQDAWAAFCDKIKHWPSRRDAKVTFQQGKLLSAADVLANQDTSSEHDIPKLEYKSKDQQADWLA